MNRVFTIPSDASSTAPGSAIVYGATGAATAIYLHAEDQHALLIALVAIALVVLLSLLIRTRAARYQWLVLSDAGIKGRAPFRFGWIRFRWEEPLALREASRCGRPGVLLRPKRSGRAIFLPHAILALPDVRATIAALAPPGHVLRAAHGDAGHDPATPRN